MARARTQRTLAAAGLSLVTGSAAIGLAVMGVGSLGQVAASVRDAGATVSRGVLSVVMPDQDSPAEQRAQRDRPSPSHAAETDAAEGASAMPAGQPHEQPQDPPAPPVLGARVPAVAVPDVPPAVVNQPDADVAAERDVAADDDDDLSDVADDLATGVLR